MSMICHLHAVPEAQAARLAESPYSVDELIQAQDRDDTLSLEKSWHGLHFVLTGSNDGDRMPLAFLLCGGQEVGEDLGYGPAHLLSPAQTLQVANALDGISA